MKSEYIDEYIKYALYLLIGLIVLGFLAEAIRALFYPYMFYGLEPGVFVDALRLRTTGELYPVPGKGLSPFIYPPVFTLILSFIISPQHIHLGYGRLLTLSASLMIFLLILKVLKSRINLNLLNITVALGLFISIHFSIRHWFVFAKPDIFAQFLGFSALYLIHKNDTRKNIFFASAIGILAVFTKQTAVWAPASIGLYLLLFNRKEVVFYLITAGIQTFLIGSVLIFLTGPGMIYFVFEVPPTNPLLFKSIHFLKIIEIFSFLLLPITLLTLHYYINLKEKKIFTIWDIALIVATPICFIASLKVQPSISHFTPVFSLMLIPAIVGFDDLVTKRRRLALSSILILFFLSSMVYFRPIVHMGFKSDLGKRSNGVVNYISGLEGKIYFPENNYYVYLAGKGSDINFQDINGAWDTKFKGPNYFRMTLKRIEDGVYDVLIIGRMRTDSLMTAAQKGGYEFDKRFGVYSVYKRIPEE